jgi:hypothetical protein
MEIGLEDAHQRVDIAIASRIGGQQLDLAGCGIWFAGGYPREATGSSSARRSPNGLRSPASWDRRVGGVLVSISNLLQKAP